MYIIKKIIKNFHTLVKVFSWNQDDAVSSHNANFNGGWHVLALQNVSCEMRVRKVKKNHCSLFFGLLALFSVSMSVNLSVFVCVFVCLYVSLPLKHIKSTNTTTQTQTPTQWQTNTHKKIIKRSIGEVITETNPKLVVEKLPQTDEICSGVASCWQTNHATLWTRYICYSLRHVTQFHAYPMLRNTILWQLFYSFLPRIPFEVIKEKTMLIPCLRNVNESSLHESFHLFLPRIPFWRH